MHPRTRDLKDLMKKQNWTANDVAEKLERSEQTVWTWCMNETKRVIPIHALKLLKQGVK